jgi:hypothetical protein
MAYRSFFSETVVSDQKSDETDAALAKERQPKLFDKIGSTEDEENLGSISLSYGGTKDATDKKFNGKLGEDTSKVKSMIKDAIGADFEKDFNDHPKLPVIPELDTKQIGKSFSIKETYKPFFESEILDNEDDIKHKEHQKLLGAVHPKVMAPEKIHTDNVEISYGYTHETPYGDHPVNSPEDAATDPVDATDKDFDGRLNEELVDDSHSTVKRAVNADFSDNKDYNKIKKLPDAPKFGDKKKSKKNESTLATYKINFRSLMEQYKSKFQENDFDDEIEVDAEEFIGKIKRLDDEVSEFPTEQLSNEKQEELKEALEGLKFSIDQALEML